MHLKLSSAKMATILPRERWVKHWSRFFQLFLTAAVIEGNHDCLQCWKTLNIIILSFHLMSLAQIHHTWCLHYNDVIMSPMASEIASLTIVYSTIYSGANQRKNQSSTSLAFVWGIHRWSVNSPHKGPVMRKMFPFDDVIMWSWRCCIQTGSTATNQSETMSENSCLGSSWFFNSLR